MPRSSDAAAPDKQQQQHWTRDPEFHYSVDLEQLEFLFEGDQNEHHEVRDGKREMIMQ